MNTVFPETPGLYGSLLQGWRRRPGSGVTGDNNQEVYAVIVKQGWILSADPDPAQGTAAPDPDGPEIFEGDALANLLQNADFAEGNAHWSTTGGASATFGDKLVELVASGTGDLRQSAGFGRQLRERTIGIAAKAEAPGGLAAPRPSVVAGGSTLVQTDPDIFADKPLTLAAAARTGAGVTAQTLSARFPTLAVDDEVLGYSELSVISTEYESDLVPFKPEADIIVIADAPPLPISVAVNGTVRFSQDALLPQELTGLGWEARTGTPREGEAGDVLNITQQLADDFRNSWFNGYRRNRRQGGSVPYLQPGDSIRLARASGDDYGFTLPTAAPQLTHKWFTGKGKDDPCLWRRRVVTLNLDTLVIEPDRDRAYAVWRACWALDDALGGQGPIAPDLNREIAVTLEGAA